MHIQYALNVINNIYIHTDNYNTYVDMTTNTTYTVVLYQGYY